jgi:predicted dehydrogenase
VIRFGLISFAHMHANDYARALNQIHDATAEARLVAVSDDDHDRGKSKCSDFGVEQFFADYRDLLASDSVDAVIIASENSKHLEQVIAAIHAGKHIICEKPITVSTHAIDEMRTALEQSTKRIYFQTAFPMRYDASVAEAKRALDAGTLGAIKAISATNHGTFPGGWFADRNLSGGGAVIDHTVHVADLIRLLTGDEFASVRAYKGANLHENVDVEDNALLYAKLEKSNAPVSIDCSWSRMPGWPIWGDVKVELVCEKGVLKIDCFNPHLDLVTNGKFSWQSMAEDLNLKMVRGFCHAVTSGIQPSACFNDGAAAAELAFAAYRSLNEGATVSVLRPDQARSMTTTESGKHSS